MIITATKFILDQSAKEIKYLTIIHLFTKARNEDRKGGKRTKI